MSAHRRQPPTNSIDLCPSHSLRMNREKASRGHGAVAGNYDPRMLEVLSEVRVQRPDFAAKAALSWYTNSMRPWWLTKTSLPKLACFSSFAKAEISIRWC